MLKLRDISLALLLCVLSLSKAWPQSRTLEHELEQFEALSAENLVDRYASQPGKVQELLRCGAIVVALHLENSRTNDLRGGYETANPTFRLVREEIERRAAQHLFIDYEVELSILGAAYASEIGTPTLRPIVTDEDTFLEEMDSLIGNYVFGLSLDIGQVLRTDDGAKATIEGWHMDCIQNIFFNSYGLGP